VGRDVTETFPETLTYMYKIIARVEHGNVHGPGYEGDRLLKFMFNVPWQASFPGLLHLQVLIACSTASDQKLEA